MSDHIVINVPTKEVKEQIQNESRFLHDKAPSFLPFKMLMDLNTLTHLYVMPDECWTIGEQSVEKIAMGCKPDPYKYEIEQIEYVNGNTIIQANYGGNTFGGSKLMVLEGVHEQRDSLDPHFIEDHPVIARFQPTKWGWELARTVAAYNCIK